jgi:hypothetical protein
MATEKDKGGALVLEISPAVVSYAGGVIGASRSPLDGDRGSDMVMAVLLLQRVPTRWGKAVLGVAGVGEQEGAALGATVQAMVKYVIVEAWFCARWRPVAQGARPGAWATSWRAPGRGRGD